MTFLKTQVTQASLMAFYDIHLSLYTIKSRKDCALGLHSHHTTARKYQANLKTCFHAWEGPSDIIPLFVKYCPHVTK